MKNCIIISIYDHLKDTDFNQGRVIAMAHFLMFCNKYGFINIEDYIFLCDLFKQDFFTVLPKDYL